MKKIVKRCLIASILILIFGGVLCVSFITVSFIKYQSIPLNAESLISPSLTIEVYDKENKLLKEDNQFNGDYCKLNDLPQYTKDAFISIEDKEFYNHKGINKKRIIKAMINNLKSGKMKEGASTISQQLIKNTHLSNEKTIERKLKEMVLTKKLESKFSKNEILESYLNIIFFGNNCYGIESASKYYFNKDASDLDLNESCTLAGLIKSPTKYSPISNYSNSIKRRNLVLNELEKDGKISVDEKIKTQNQPITLTITSPTADKLNSYSQSSIDEASKILKIPAKQIAIAGYKIHTYMEPEKQQALKNALSNNKVENIDNAGIVIDNKTHGISAYQGNSQYKLADIRRQPASCIKPILVYSPAINEGIISPATQILDEPLKIGEYSPNNVSNKFSGYISVKDAVKNSINIPAIKVLSYVGIETGKDYAKKMGIPFDQSDDSYSIALGGMTYGTTLKELTTSYTTLANDGNYADSTFVQYITDKNNKLVYIHKPAERMVLRADTAYLMTDILKETAKTGTAKRLKDVSNTEIASKTGTVGKKNTHGNIDSYNISYTPTETIGVWFGSLNNTPSNIAGGNQPTEVVKQYISSQTYDKKTFDIPSSVAQIKIDSLEKEENHRIVLASPYSPERFTETWLFSRFNSPTEVSQNFTEKPQIKLDSKVEKNQIILDLDAQKHVEYQIYKNGVPYQNIQEKQGIITIRINFPENKATIKIVAQYSGETNTSLETEEEFSFQKTEQTSVSKKEKWYI